MAVHTHAHHRGARPGPGRKAIKELSERPQREQRDLADALRERAGQGPFRCGMKRRYRASIDQTGASEAVLIVPVHREIGG